MKQNYKLCKKNLKKNVIQRLYLILNNLNNIIYTIKNNIKYL